MQKTNVVAADSLVDEEVKEVETQSAMLEHKLHQYLHTVLLTASTYKHMRIMTTGISNQNKIYDNLQD